MYQKERFELIWYTLKYAIHINGVNKILKFNSDELFSVKLTEIK